MLSTDVSSAPTIDISGLQLALSEKQNELPLISRSGMSTIIPDPDPDANTVLNLAGMFNGYTCSFKPQYF